MELIDYGYKIPTDEDEDFWATIIFDIERLSTHNHDGVNSARLATGAVAPFTADTFAAADWLSASPDPGYRLLFTFNPSWGVSWADGGVCPLNFVVREESSNDIVYCRQARGSSGSIYFYSYVQFDGTIGVF